MKICHILVSLFQIQNKSKGTILFWAQKDGGRNSPCPGKDSLITPFFISACNSISMHVFSHLISGLPLVEEPCVYRQIQ